MSFGRLVATATSSQQFVGRLMTMNRLSCGFGLTSRTPFLAASKAANPGYLSQRFFNSSSAPSSSSFSSLTQSSSTTSPLLRLSLRPSTSSLTPTSSLRFFASSPSTNETPSSSPSASISSSSSATASSSPSSSPITTTTTISPPSSPSPSSLPSDTIPAPAFWWTVSGLLPLGAGAAAVIAAPTYLPTALAASLVFYQVTFATTLLSFMGGIHFGFAAANLHQSPPGTPAGWLRYSLTMVPFAISWAAPALPIETTMTLLLTGYSSLLLSETIVAPKGYFPSWWLRLRFPVTLLVLGLLGTTYLLGAIPM